MLVKNTGQEIFLCNFINQVETGKRKWKAGTDQNWEHSLHYWPSLSFHRAVGFEIKRENVCLLNLIKHLAF